MRTFFKFSFFIIVTITFFTGCAQKINSDSINKSILPNNLYNLTTFLNSKTVSTYDKKEGKITTYYFKNNNGQLEVTNEIDYIPLDQIDQLYSPFSKVVRTLNKLTNHQAKTIEEALSMEVEKKNFTRLYYDKEEYIIENDFARDLKWSIREFKDMIQRQEDREGFRLSIIFPIF